MSQEEKMMQQFRDQQQKFVYYIVALSVTAIGFSVYKTTGSPLKYSQIPLGLAILFWGVSIACGITFLRYAIAGIYNNIEYLNLIKEIDHQSDVDTFAEAMKKVLNDNSNTASDYFKWQLWLFYSGVISFLIWHILEMYISSNFSCSVLMVAV